jgi:mycothiol synthase
VTHTRPFREWSDLPAMQAVCSATLRAAPGRAVAHPGDIAWMAGWHPRSIERLGEEFLLWEDDGEVVGFGALEPDDGDLSLFVTPARSETEGALAFEEDALAWATRDGAAPTWTEFEDAAAAVERWTSRGYRPTDVGYLNLVRPLDDVPPDAAADERVQPVGEDDVEGRATVTHDAFEEPQPLADYVADYRGFRASPTYPHGWDLLLRDADGNPAACCIAWTDRLSRASTFEPVATHPSMHRRGFGAALLREGCRRLAAAGMTYAIVGVELGNAPAEALYRSVGFRPDRVLRTYAPT